MKKYMSKIILIFMAFIFIVNKPISVHADDEPNIKSGLVKEVLGDEVIYKTGVIDGVQYYVYSNYYAVAEIKNKEHKIQLDLDVNFEVEYEGKMYTIYPEVRLVIYGGNQFYVGDYDMHNIFGKGIPYSNLYDINGVNYFIYEKYATCYIEKDEYDIKKEIEYEGKTYPVIGITGCSPYIDDTTEIKIPDFIKYLGGYFGANTKIPDTVEIMHFGARPYSDVEEIKPKSNITYCAALKAYNYKEKGYQLSIFGTFNKCKDLEKVTIPEGIEIIDCSFRYCNSLKKVTFPSTIDERVNNAFEKCTRLKEYDNLANYK